ncbi:MAG TPA: Trp family transcriptional regulator [Spirochaetota bacterium]|nr:Trp family transcriptional regulator [Spirochaetota bacterium]
MKDIRDVADVMLSIKGTDEMTQFLNEILTDNERRDLVIRWELMNRLYDGRPQRAIASDLGISLCRITRGAKILKSGNSVVEKLLKRSRGEKA